MTRLSHLVLFCFWVVVPPFSAPADESQSTNNVLVAADRAPDESSVKEIATVKPSALVNHLALSQDGKRLLISGSDKYEVFDAEGGKNLSNGPAKPVADRVVAAAISRDGEMVLLAIASNEWVLLEADTGKQIRDGKTKTVPVGAMFLSDGKQAQVIEQNTTVHRISIGDGAVRTLPATMDYTFKNGFMGSTSPDGKVFTALIWPGDQHLQFLYCTDKDVRGFWFSNKGPVLGDSPSVIAASKHFLASIDSKEVLHTASISDDYASMTGISGYQTRGRSHGLRPLAFTSDEKWLLRLSKQGIEVRPVASVLTTFHYADLADAQHYTFAADVFRLAAGTSEKVSVYELPKPESPSGELMLTLHRHLMAKEFDQLDDYCELLKEDDSFFPWAPDQTKLNLVCAFLLSNSTPDALRPDRLKMIAVWLGAKPKSPLPRVLMARKAVEAAWRARGADFAINVTPEGRKVFRDKIDEAHKILSPLIGDPDAPLEVYDILFEIAKSQGWSQEKCEPHIAML